MAGDVEERIADAVADVVVRCSRVPGGLAKADAVALRRSARSAARDVAGEVVTPLLVKVASLAERIEWMESRSGRGREVI